MSSTQDAVTTLNSQWYNALAAQCSLDPKTFQLVQGYVPVGTTSETLWNLFDSVPPLSVSTKYNPGQISSFSQNYTGVISALIAQGQTQFQSALGDYYSQWNNYKSTISPLPSGTAAWLQAFQNWAQAKLPQGLVTSAITAYETMLKDPIATAANMLIQVGFAQTNPGIYAYTTTIGQLRLALNSAASKMISMNSKSESTDISKTWANANMSGAYDFFSGSGNVSYSQYASQITGAGLNINVSFDKLVTLSAGPLKQPSSDTELQQFTPWFNSGALSEGYASQNNNVWKAGDDITWASTFGPNGNLQRYCAGLVIVDGISMTLSSSAGFQKGDQQQINAAAQAGIWPFFQASGNGGWSTTATVDNSGAVTVTSSCAQGNPQVIGVIVSSINSSFS